MKLSCWKVNSLGKHLLYFEVCYDDGEKEIALVGEFGSLSAIASHYFDTSVIDTAGERVVIELNVRDVVGFVSDVSNIVSPKTPWVSHMAIKKMGGA